MAAILPHSVIVTSTTTDDNYNNNMDDCGDQVSPLNFSPSPSSSSCSSITPPHTPSPPRMPTHNSGGGGDGKVKGGGNGNRGSGNSNSGGQQQHFTVGIDRERGVDCCLTPHAAPVSAEEAEHYRMMLMLSKNTNSTSALTASQSTAMDLSHTNLMNLSGSHNNNMNHFHNSQAITVRIGNMNDDSNLSDEWSLDDHSHDYEDYKNKTTPPVHPHSKNNSTQQRIANMPFAVPPPPLSPSPPPLCPELPLPQQSGSVLTEEVHYCLKGSTTTTSALPVLSELEAHGWPPTVRPPSITHSPAGAAAMLQTPPRGSAHSQPQQQLQQPTTIVSLVPFPDLAPTAVILDPDVMGALRERELEQLERAKRDRKQQHLETQVDEGEDEDEEEGDADDNSTLSSSLPSIPKQVFTKARADASVTSSVTFTISTATTPNWREEYERQTRPSSKRMERLEKRKSSRLNLGPGGGDNDPPMAVSECGVDDPNNNDNDPENDHGRYLPHPHPHDRKRTTSENGRDKTPSAAAASPRVPSDWVQWLNQPMLQIIFCFALIFLAIMLGVMVGVRKAVNKEAPAPIPSQPSNPVPAPTVPGASPAAAPSSSGTAPAPSTTTTTTTPPIQSNFPQFPLECMDADPPRMDSDGDGVDDCVDYCPGTDGSQQQDGVVVDQYGCLPLYCSFGLAGNHIGVPSDINQPMLGVQQPVFFELVPCLDENDAASGNCASDGGRCVSLRSSDDPTLYWYQDRGWLYTSVATPHQAFGCAQASFCLLPGEGASPPSTVSFRALSDPSRYVFVGAQGTGPIMMHTEAAQWSYTCRNGVDPWNVIVSASHGGSGGPSAPADVQCSARRRLLLRRSEPSAV